MSIELSLSTPDNASNPISIEQTISQNNTAISEAFGKALSRLGGEPNYMRADLDLNGFDLLNVGDSKFITRPDLEGIKAGEFQVNGTTGDLEYRGPDDLTWTVLYTQAELTGPAGAGNGDLEAVNNLSDVDNVVTARSNLGLEIGVDVQPYDINLVGFDPTTKADVGDPRFKAYPVNTFIENVTLSTAGVLYRFEGITAGFTATLPSQPDGSVITVHNPATSPGPIIIAADGGISLYLDGSTSTSATLLLGVGGVATFLCSHTVGTTFLASGTNLTEP